MKKVFFTLMFCIFLLGSVSAITEKSFDKDIGDYGKITFSDRYWLDLFGWFETTLAEYTLSYNTEQCFSCFAEGSAILYTDGYLFTNLGFENTIGKKIDDAQADYLIAEIQNIIDSLLI